MACLGIHILQHKIWWICDPITQKLNWAETARSPRRGLRVPALTQWWNDFMPCYVHVYNVKVHLWPVYWYGRPSLLNHFICHSWYASYLHISVQSCVRTCTYLHSVQNYQLHAFQNTDIFLVVPLTQSLHICMFACIHSYPSICLSVLPSIHSSIHPYPPIHHSFHLPSLLIHPHLSIHPSIYPFII